MKLSAALSEYRVSCAAVPVTPSTWRGYDQKLRTFFAWLKSEFGMDDLEGLGVRHINGFVVFLNSTPSLNGRGVRSSYTVKSYIEVIRNFLSWAAAEELIEQKTRDRIQLPRVEKKVIRTLSRAQFDLLHWATANEATREMQLRDRAILCLLLDTGLRAAELCSLTVGNLHLGDDSHVLVKGKGNKQREIGPLGTETQRALRRHLRGHEYPTVFVNRRHQSLTVGGLDQILYRLEEWAGAAEFDGVRVSAHTFRHTFAVNFMKAGGDIYTLSLLLGHTSVSTTQGYLKDFQQREARRGRSVLDQF
jgi:site-specific recombinase XerD